MHRPGHYGVALALYAPLGGTLVAFDQQALALAGGVGVLAVTNIPDVDGKTDRLQHRGPTHSLVFALFVGLLTAMVAGLLAFELGPVAVLGVAMVGFLVGVLGIVAHLVADALNPMGVRPLWPFSSRRFTLDLVLASNRAANYVLLAVGVVASVLGWFLGSALR